MTSLSGLAAATSLALLRLRLPGMLRRRGLVRVLGELTPDAPLEPRDPGPLRQSIVATEAALARLRLQQTCLYRSLARYAALKRAGRAVRFVIGTRRGAGGVIESHAWVEGDALGLEDAGAAGYEVLFAYP